jgi:two-component system, LytTR family, response regulator
MTKYSVIIIDDEEPARLLIKNYLSKHAEFELVAECENGFEGLKAIQELKPDLLFLDVQMPKISGFELLELLDEYPAIIFSTAYDEYAIKAFDLNAVDYLLKPYGQDRFDKSIYKAAQLLADKVKFEEPIKALIETRPEQQPVIDRIVVKTGSKITVVPTAKIQYLEADDDYVEVHTLDERYLKQQTMKYFEAHLDDSEFIRVHRSFIVRISEIIQLEQYEKDSKILILKSGKKIKVSKTRLKNLKEKLGI